jgi:hypothetical protein
MEWLQSEAPNLRSLDGALTEPYVHRAEGAWKAAQQSSERVA